MKVALLKRLWVWMSRIGHVLGFGIQSPSAYQFVRYVINEHYPYYGYDDLRKSLPSLDAFSRKMGELYFRLSNYCQADSVFIFGDVPGYVNDYIRCGCHHTLVERFDSPEALLDEFDLYVPASFPGWAIVNLDETAIDVLRFFVSKAPSDFILVIENIHASRRNKMLWKELLADARVVVTFDLYYCGILQFDPTKSKENFTVNF